MRHILVDLNSAGHGQAHTQAPAPLVGVLGVLPVRIEAWRFAADNDAVGVVDGVAVGVRPTDARDIQKPPGGRFSQLPLSAKSLTSVGL